MGLWMVLVKNWQFFLFLILGKIGQENVFYDVLERKNAFPGIKNKKFKKSRKWKFSKGVSPWFWSKIVNFFLLLFHVKKAGKMRFTIFQKEKTCFYAIKTRSSKSRKIRIFSQGLVHNFGLKLSIFPSFCFRQKRPGKCVSRYSRKKKRLSTLKNKKFKKSKNQNFFKEVSPWFLSKLAIFPSFYFRQHRPGICLSRYSRIKKKFLDHLKNRLKKLKD